MNLKPWEFYELSLIEYMYLKRGVRKARKKELQEDFLHIRIQAYYSILPYLDKKDRKKTIDQLIPDIYAEKKEEPAFDYKALIERYKKAGALSDKKRKK